MHEAIMATFPLSEYSSRINALVEQMNKRGINAAVITADDMCYYFTGFNSIVWDSKVSTPGVIVITKDGDVTLSTTKTAVPTAYATSCVSDIRYYNRYDSDDGYETYAKAITSILKEKKLDHGKIGFELGHALKMHLNHFDREALFAEIPNAEIINIADCIWPIRKCKSPLEINYLRKVCEINHIGIEAGLKRVQEGTTELELYRNIVIEYFKLGAEKSMLLGVRAGPERYPHSNCPPSDRPIGRGDCILVDGGPFYKGYCSDIIRMAVIGKPSDEQQEIFDIARDACYAGIEATKPGVPISHAVEKMDKVMRRNEKYVEYYSPHGGGHSLGVNVHEYPMILSSVDEVFEEGMVYAIEPYFLKEGVGRLGIEENVLVTKTGYEILTPSDSRLMVL